MIVSGVDEDSIRASSGERLVGALAEVKARAVAAGIDSDALVLGCDSMLEIDGAVFGKPGSAGIARARWQQMRGREGALLTGHALLSVRDGQITDQAVEVARTTVRFADLTDAEIDAYVATGEPLNVAGGFTVDGRGGWFVDGIDGDHHNVVGLSLPLLRRMLASVGVSVHELPAVGSYGAL